MDPMRPVTPPGLIGLIRSANKERKEATMLRELTMDELRFVGGGEGGSEGGNPDGGGGGGSGGNQNIVMASLATDIVKGVVTGLIGNFIYDTAKIFINNFPSNIPPSIVNNPPQMTGFDMRDMVDLQNQAQINISNSAAGM